MLAVERKVADEYFAMKNEVVTIAEYQMLKELLDGRTMKEIGRDLVWNRRKKAGKSIISWR